MNYASEPMPHAAPAGGPGMPGAGGPPGPGGPPPPRSADPLRDYLDAARHGVDRSYVVVPRAVAESMPLPWQDRFAQLLHELHQTFGGLPWPLYRVVPSRHERLADLDEEQLAEVGCIVEIDADGELRHRDREGRVIEDPERHEVLVSCLDPLTRVRSAQQRRPLQPSGPPSGPLPAQHQGQHPGPHPGQHPGRPGRQPGSPTWPASRA